MHAEDRDHRLSYDREIAVEALVSLYDSVGWAAYTRDPAGLRAAVSQSTFVATEWDTDGALLGLARALSDDVSIFYLQDVLVRPSHQRQGIGKTLLGACLERFAHVRQKVLLTDGSEAQQRFYESFGYAGADDFRQAPLRAFVRIDPWVG